MRPFLSRALGAAVLVFVLALLLAVPVALAGVTAPLKADKAVSHRSDESPTPKDTKPPKDGDGDDDSSSPPSGTTTTPTPPQTSPGPAPVPEPPASPAPSEPPRQVPDPSKPAPPGDDPTPAPPSQPAPPPADAPAPPSPAVAAKIDPALADIQRAALSVDPATPIRVIVFGPSAAAAGTAADATPGRSLAGAGAASMVVAAKDLNTLADARGVSYVVADLPVAPTSSLDEEPTFSALASLVPDIDRAPAAWRAGLTGAGVGIAVIDSGVAPDGVFGRRLVEVPLGGSGDAYGHGTFVAGVAAGSGDGFSGIAPGARVYGVGVARGNAVYTSDVLAGLEWVLANHARLHIRVVTLSLSETVPSSYVADPLDTAVEQLWKAGVVVVVSAGNLGPNSAVFAPANDPFAITVGATDPAGTLDASDDFVATFSSSGVTLDGVRKPDVLAPGRHVVSLLPTGSALADAAPAQNRLTGEFATMSGTSFSAPQVAGAAALLLQRHRTWTPDQVKWVLVNSARPLEGSVAGSLDVEKATTFRGVPGRTGAGLRASKFGLKGQKTASFRAQTAQAPKWDASTWNASTWNASTWNASTWNASTWNAWDQD